MAEQGSSFSVIASGVTQTSYVATSLTAGTTYEFKVEARNEYGFSDLSSVLAILCSRVPDKPINLTEDNSVRTSTTNGLTWTEGAFNGGLPVIDYRINQKEQGGSYSEIASGITTTSYTVTSLVVGTTYEFTVEARNSNGYSPVSDSVTILHIVQPDKPVSLAEHARSYTELGISWSPGSSDGGSAVLDYRVSMAV